MSKKLLLALGGNFILRLALIPIVPFGWGAVAALGWGILSDLGIALLIAQPSLIAASNTSRWSFFILGTLIWSCSLFWLAIQFAFFWEFGTRPDHIVVDYIAYTGEITGNVWESYPVLAITAGCLVIGALYTGIPSTPKACSWRRRGMQALAGLTLFMGSVFWVPPLADATHRELAKNGSATFIRAVITGQLDYFSHYTALPNQQAIKLVRKKLASDSEWLRFTSVNGIRRVMVSPHDRRNVNVVLIIAESLGSELTGLSKGLSFTPQFDKLLEESLVFTRFYATGTRTARGLEGVWASFPPIPGNSVLQRKPLRPMDTLASVLRERKYRTVFLYGGRPEFDEMGPFAFRNGFEEVIGQSDIQSEMPGKKPAFSTAWGYADEVVFDRALQELRKNRSSHPRRPLFLSVLTVSNHRPFLFPQRNIKGEQGTREGATRYADWALGQFFRQAKSEGFGANTLFVVVADHGPRSYLRNQLPVDAHRIPLVFWGPDWLPKEKLDKPIGSSVDVAPTVMGFLGGQYEASFFGHDLMHVPADQGWAFLQNKRDVGTLLSNRLVVVGFNNQLASMEVDSFDRLGSAKKLSLQDPAAAMATAFFQTAYQLYTSDCLVPVRTTTAKRTSTK